MIPAVEGLRRLREGNRRFVDGDAARPVVAPDRRRALAEGQTPFAVVFGCSDSRVPTELVFDQGAGDLFVVRVAGHVPAPAAVGSVEFAAAQLGTRLVVVLGHTGCGAVQATLDHLAQPGELPSPNLAAIVDSIRPAVETHRDASAAVRANVRATTAGLRAGPVLAPLIRDEGLRVVGAEYALETGAVDFFDGADDLPA